MNSAIKFIYVFLLILTASIISAEPVTISADPDKSLSPSEIHQIMWDNLRDRMIRYQDVLLKAREISASNWNEYDINYYRLDLEIDHINELLYGRVGIYGKVTVSALDSIVIDLLDDMTIDSIYGLSGNLNYQHGSGLVKITLDREYTQDESFGFTVVYHGTPSGEGGFLGFDFSTWYGRPLISTLSEPSGARSWWPCNDITIDKADSVDILVTVDTSLVVSSNGLQVSDNNNGDGTHTVWWHESYPISTYLVSLGIHSYTVWYDWYHYAPTDSMPLHFYVYPEEDLNSRQYFGQIAHMIEVLSSRFGEYPFIDEKYGCTHFNWSGAMEHQTNTSTTASSFGYKKGVMAHELGHQWWGDMVTCGDWHHIWINEGFAVYSEALFFESDSGLAFYHDFMNSFEYTDTTRSIYIHDTTSIFNIFGPIVYDKGGWVLHMLRHVIGDQDFFDALAEYRSQYLWKNATTEDFQQVVESVSGQDLDYFFQQWIYGVGRPRYKYSYLSEPVPEGGWHTYLNLKQLQTTDPQAFTMPVDIVIGTAGGSETHPVFNNQREQNFIFYTAEEPTMLSIDPDRWISRTLSQEAYAINILTESFPEGVQYQEYAETLLVKGAAGGFVCSIVEGDLPAGLSLETGTGIVSGFVRSAGNYSVKIKAIDYVSPQNVDTAVVNIMVTEAAGLPGDANFDGLVNVGDGVFILSYIFKSGAAPSVPNWADVNADCAINIGDVVRLSNHVFKPGSPPPLPGCVE